MTDTEDEEITSNLPTTSFRDVDNRKIEMNQAESQFQRTEKDRGLRIYKKLINMKFQSLDVAAVDILRVVASSDEIGDERVLLGSLALATVFHAKYDYEVFINELKKYLSLKEPFLSSFNENIQINDLEWFKLAIIHGYLQVKIKKKIYTREMIFMIFEILHRNCQMYTKYSYVAYKILQTLLEKTSKVNFWLDNDTDEIETKLEAVVFSNWDNCISEIVRKNASKIFPAYMKIMSKKYDGFLKFIFDNCMQNLSWQNVTKYTILVEICEIFDDLTSIVNSGLTSCIFTSLTKNHLKHKGTLVYLTILKKLKIDDWQRIFGEDFFLISAKWESEKELIAIELLWEQWMKPTIQKFSDIFEYLWKHPSMKELKLSQMYLEKIGDQQSFELIYKDTNIHKILNSRIIDNSEIVRLNAFAIISRCNNWKIIADETEPFITVKRFLYFNINANTIFMRKGIIENFKIFLANVIKLADKDPIIDHHVCKFFEWLHELLLDCFEIGSTYQRKILGLSLYGVILNFTTDSFVDGLSVKATRYKATLKCANALRMRMIEQNIWKFNDRKSVFLIFRLVLDEMDDVRDKSTSIIIRYFDRDVITNMDKKVLMKTALEACNSSKFHEISGGSNLIKILVAWQFTKENYIDFFLKEATAQLSRVKKDILKSVTQESPFFGALTAILEIGFMNKIENEAISNDSMQKLLDLIEESTNFFLSTLSTNDSDSEYSSSFKDMGIAIKAMIDKSEMYRTDKAEMYLNVYSHMHKCTHRASKDDNESALLPAYQLILLCIWMSLKVSCDLAAEIGCTCENEEIVNRSANFIVSILLKCRHKGVIEAAGLAIAKLTKVLCKKKYDEVMKNHLINLLSIDSKDNINLTRRGAGLTIMFHRIVSSDCRNNRPFVHFAVRTLLDSLDSKNFTFNEDCEKDSTCARHLHFLRSLVADKGLQDLLVLYMEDVCLLCLEYLQFPEWNVRNASLQLFGAIVPRLVGQCSARELDYGIGNSIDYFVTHYPILAKNIIDKLEESTNWLNRRKKFRSKDLTNANSIVPILTLLSKMSTGGCDLIDYSSKDYVIRGKSIFFKLLAHPVFHVRALAAKAYAAFVPFADIIYELTMMKMRKINWYENNHNHGQLLTQYYLERKYEHEIKCTSKNFSIRDHEIYTEAFKTATTVQLERAKYCWIHELYTKFDPPSVRYTIHNLSCFSISAMLLKCIINCPLSMLRIVYHHDINEYRFVSSLFTKKVEKSPMLGLSEFLKNVIAFNGQFLTCKHTRLFYTKYAENFHHYEIFSQNPSDLSENYQLNHLLTDALQILKDPSKIHILIHELWTIVDILKSMEVNEKIVKKNLSSLSNQLRDQSGENRLKIFGCIIDIENSDTCKNETGIILSTYRLTKGWNNEIEDDAATKNLLIELISHVVENIVSENVNPFIRHSKHYNYHYLFEDIVDLMHNDMEIGEVLSDKMLPITRMIIGEPCNSICARANTLKILDKLFYWDESGQKLPRVVKDMIVYLGEARNILKEYPESPYNEDEIFQRNHTELLNILFYFLETVQNKKSLTGNDDNVELQQINGIILAKYELQQLAQIDVINIENYLKLSTQDYLTSKSNGFIREV